MPNNDLIKAVLNIIDLMDGAADNFEETSTDLQKQIEQYILIQSGYFETKGGKYVPNQDYRRQVNKIGKGVRKILDGDEYQSAIKEYLNELGRVEKENVKFQKRFNDLEIDVKKLNPSRQYVFETAQHYLNGAGLDEQYIQPVKYLLMQQVTSGATIRDSRKLIKRWGKGELTSGEETFGRQTPNLQRYAGQIARDSAYQFNGTINQIVRDSYNLDSFIYVGNLVKDSRPLCKHLVDRDEPIPFDELPELLEKYPSGLIPGTNEDNFIIYRGGYNCRHTVTAISSED